MDNAGTDQGTQGQPLMKLRYSPTSPYVRMVMVTLHETGRAGAVELIPTNVWDPGTDIAGDNPLGKVPALILDDGTTYIDSSMICEYLDSRHDGAKLYPAPGPERWSTLRRYWLAKGVIDATIDRVVEVGRRPEELRWPQWLERRKAATGRALDLLEREVPSLGDGVTIAHVGLGCALGYLDLRFPGDDWRTGRPNLARWYDDGFARRPAMVATVPQDPA